MQVGRGRLAFQPFVPSGHLVVSPFGCLSVWPFGRLTAWQFGRLAAWPMTIVMLWHYRLRVVHLSAPSRTASRERAPTLERVSLYVKCQKACLLPWFAGFPSLSGPGSGLCSCVVCGPSLGAFRSVPGPVLLVGDDPRTDPFLCFSTRQLSSQDAVLDRYPLLWRCLTSSLQFSTRLHEAGRRYFYSIWKWSRKFVAVPRGHWRVRMQSPLCFVSW